MAAPSPSGVIPRCASWAAVAGERPASTEVASTGHGEVLLADRRGPLTVTEPGLPARWGWARRGSRWERSERATPSVPPWSWPSGPDLSTAMLWLWPTPWVRMLSGMLRHSLR